MVSLVRLSSATEPRGWCFLTSAYVCLSCHPLVRGLGCLALPDRAKADVGVVGGGGVYAFCGLFARWCFFSVGLVF